jgi:hypothetical protein
MSYPQLAGRGGASTAPTGTSTVWLAVIVLAIIVGTLAWRFMPHSVPVTSPTEPAAAAIKQAPAPKLDLSEDQQLHLAHAEQQLITAATQLTTARRLLASLGPALTRNYLVLEQRQADAAWTACDTAQRAIEDARTHVTFVTARKD